MARKLTAQELDILRVHADAGDRVAYYSSLASFDNRYGELALGVTNNDTLAGKTANLYFLTIAAMELGPNPVSEEQLATISLNLMREDFALRDANGGVDLTVDDIQGYHENVFGAVAGVSADGWTPYRVLESLDDVEGRQAYWDELLSSTAVGSWATSAAETILDDPAYFVLLTQVGITAAATSSNIYGPYYISIPGAGEMVGGGTGADLVSGSSSDDVLIGFNGDDTFEGTSGSDRIYGGVGEDTVDYSTLNLNIIIQLGNNQFDRIRPVVPL